MIHSKFKNLNSKFSLPRYDPFTAKPGFFLAQVVGESMSRRIPNGSWCLFREPSDGSRNGKVVIVQSRDIQDPDTGGQYTVQIYRSEKTETEGSWSHRSIRLEPDSMDFNFKPLTLEPDTGNDLHVVGEYVGRRIVTKLDQLMALVDQLETQLATSRATAKNLLEALVAELTTQTSAISKSQSGPSSEYQLAQL